MKATGVNETNGHGEEINENLAVAIREVVRAIRDIDYGSVEIVVHNSHQAAYGSRRMEVGAEVHRGIVPSDPYSQ